MDLLAIFLSAVLGAIGGVIGLVISLFIKKDSKYANFIKPIIIVLSISIVMGLWEVVLKPNLYEYPRARMELENGIYKNKTISSVFKAIQKYDNTTYDIIMDDIVKTIVANKSNLNEALLKVTALSAQYTKKYFIEAENTIVFEYLALLELEWKGRILSQHELGIA